MGAVWLEVIDGEWPMTYFVCKILVRMDRKRWTIHPMHAPATIEARTDRATVRTTRSFATDLHVLKAITW